jgi:hypothetical protein
LPFVTFTVRRGLSNADKFHLSAAMIEAQVAAGFQRDDLFHRFLRSTTATFWQIAATRTTQRTEPIGS